MFNWKLKFRHALCNLHTVHIRIATGCITSDGIINIYKNNGVVTWVHSGEHANPLRAETQIAVSLSVS